MIQHRILPFAGSGATSSPHPGSATLADPALPARRVLLQGGLGLTATALLPGCMTAPARRLPPIDAAGLQALVPARNTLPGIRELDELTRHMAAAGMAVERIGTSRGGRPIHLISPPARGRLNALVIGTPHPNEPIGGLSLMTLLEMLRNRHPLLEQLPFRWHFIPSIDPDGLALNDAWLNTPGDFRAYARGFFRPAFADQAEYSFPLQTAGYRFERTTSETRAWMSVIDRLRPELMVSLHNADLGGVFTVLSKPQRALAADLSRIAGAHGIALDEDGDPYAELQKLAPGVFLAEDLVAMVEQAPQAWPAGNSSSGYSARYGTLTLIPEVPLWQETVVEGQRLSSDTAKGLSGVYESSLALVERAKALAATTDGSDLLMNSILEGAPTLKKLLAAHSQQPPTLMPATRVNGQRRILRMLPLRTLGVLDRWCRLQADNAGGADRRQALERLGRETSGLMTSLLADESLTAGMIATPPRVAAAAQVHAALGAAMAVAG